jgi:enolase
MCIAGLGDAAATHAFATWGRAECSILIKPNQIGTLTENLGRSMSSAAGH